MCLQGAHFGDLRLRLRDLALLLSLRGDQHVDLTLEFGDARFQCLSLDVCANATPGNMVATNKAAANRWRTNGAIPCFINPLPMQASRSMAMLCRA